MSNELALIEKAALPASLDAVRNNWNALQSKTFDWFGDKNQPGMIALADLRLIVPALREALLPVQRNEAVAMMDRLVGAFPNHASIPNVEVYCAELVRLASTYPQGVVELAVDTLIRRHKFPPSIKETLDGLEEHMRPLRGAWQRASRMVEMQGKTVAK